MAKIKPSKNGSAARSPGPTIQIGIAAKDRAAVVAGLSKLLADTYTLYRDEGEDEGAERRLSRQQDGIAEQALRGLRSADELAAALGEELGRSEVLLRRLSAQEDSAWLN